MTRYVQSKWSKDAPVWEIIGTYTGNSSYWSTKGQAVLPKSEYIEVPAPEEWEDVTNGCETYRYGYENHKLYIYHCGNIPNERDGYRLEKAKVASLPGVIRYEGDASVFIVKRKVQP